MKLLLVIALLLAACSASTPEPVTAQSVVDSFVAAGLEVSDAQPAGRPEAMPDIYQFRERMTFTIAEVAPKGGQVLICELRPHCDLLMEFYKAFEALGGPYYYQSPSGLVVAQLNNGLSTETAEKFEQVIKGLE
jgi:hypothetical protein